MTFQPASAQLFNPTFVAALAELSLAAANDERELEKARAVAARLPAPPTVEQVSDLCEAAALPVRPELGRLLYLLVRLLRPKTCVEFGTSFGASLLYISAALRDNGAGHAYGTELNRRKLARAQANLDRCELGHYATILEGDARETLARIQAPLDLVLLDGWKDLYLPVLEVLEPKMQAGTLVVADNLSMLPDAYVRHVRDQHRGYVSISLPLGDGVEISLRQF